MALCRKAWHVIMFKFNSSWCTAARDKKDSRFFFHCTAVTETNRTICKLCKSRCSVAITGRVHLGFAVVTAFHFVPKQLLHCVHLIVAHCSNVYDIMLLCLGHYLGQNSALIVAFV